jgi:hypothetical protein
MALKWPQHYPVYFALDEQINFARCFPAVGWKWAGRTAVANKTADRHRFSRSWLEGFCPNEPAVGWKIPPAVDWNLCHLNS